MFLCVCVCVCVVNPQGCKASYSSCSSSCSHRNFLIERMCTFVCMCVSVCECGVCVYTRSTICWNQHFSGHVKAITFPYLSREFIYWNEVRDKDSWGGGERVGCGQAAAFACPSQRTSCCELTIDIQRAGVRPWMRPSSRPRSHIPMKQRKRSATKGSDCFPTDAKLNTSQAPELQPLTW